MNHTELPPPKPLSDNALRETWRQAGGRLHGPHIETGTMPEAKLLPFLRCLIAEAVAAEREACIDLVAFYGGPVDLEAAIRARGESNG